MSRIAEALLLGFDIGGTKTAVAVATTDARDVEETPIVHTFSTPPRADAALADAIAIARGLVGERPVLAIGVSFGGPVERGPQTRVRSRHVPGWSDIRLGDELRVAFNAPVSIENDANAGAIGEALAAGDWATTLVYLTISTGIGGAVMIDGQLHRGRSGLAGEIGHLPMASDGPLCSCGHRGHLEALASGPAIARAAMAALTGGLPESSLGRIVSEHGALTARDVAEAAAAGDGLAVSVLASAGRHIGHAVAISAMILDPDLVIVGGGVSLAGESLWRPLRDEVEAQLASLGVAPAIRPAAHGSESALRGSIELARRAAVSASHAKPLKSHRIVASRGH
jgi:glucokinase